MKLKGRKLLVFIINHITLTAIIILAFFFAPDQIQAIGPTIIIMIVGNGFVYIGGNVADAWQKSKYYQSELNNEPK